MGGFKIWLIRLVTAEIYARLRILNLAPILIATISVTLASMSQNISSIPQ